MTEMPIPEDIDRIATDLVRADYSGDDDPDWKMYESIARALMAERERCAKIVEDNQEVVNLKSSARLLAPRVEGNLAGIAFAAAIRNQA